METVASMEAYRQDRAISSQTWRGTALTKIVDSPYFVDSRFTAGIQLADMVAGVLRQYYEKELFLQSLPMRIFLRLHDTTASSKKNPLTSLIRQEILHGMAYI